MHDKLFKKLLQTFFVEFLELFFPELVLYMDQTSIIFLDKEVLTDVTSIEAHEVDLVVQARVRDGVSHFLIHVEAQSEQQATFNNRMFRYFARLHEKYGAPVYPIAVFSFDSPRTKQVGEYNVQFPDLHVLRFSYRVVQLNRLNWRQFVRQPSPVAAALMSKMKVAAEDRAEVKLECLRMIATLKLDKARTRLISGFVDQYLRLNPTEERTFVEKLAKVEDLQGAQIMEIVTSWMERGIEQGLEQGREQGREQGLAEGREQGRRLGQSEVLITILRQRLGSVDESLVSKIGALTQNNIELLTASLLGFASEDDLRKWLDSHE